MPLVLHLGDLGGTFGWPLPGLELLLVSQHVGSVVDGKAEGLRTEPASHSPSRLLTLLCVFLSGPTGIVRRRRHGIRLAMLNVGGEGLVKSVLPAVRLHVLGEGEHLAALSAAEGLLARVQELVLVEEAAVLEGLAADVAQVGAHAVRVLATVVLHDRVVLEDHVALWALVGLEGGVTPLVLAQGKEVVERLRALLAPEHVLLGVSGHVLGDGDLHLEVLSAQWAMVRLFGRFVAIVAPQLVDGGEDGGALGALKAALLRCFRLYLWREKWLLLLPVFVPVFDEAAAVLESETALFAGEWRQVVLVCVKVAVEVERLATVELLSAVFAFQTKFLGLGRQVSDRPSGRLFLDVSCAVKFSFDAL